MIDEKSLLRVQSLELKKDAQRNAESDNHRRTGNETDRPLAHFFLYDRAQKTIDDGANQRQEDNPAKNVCRYLMIHLTPYPFAPPRFRFIFSISDSIQNRQAKIQN